MIAVIIAHLSDIEEFKVDIAFRAAVGLMLAMVIYIVYFVLAAQIG
jgi:hypothetical protein